jgi:hypothetical protein
MEMKMPRPGNRFTGQRLILALFVSGAALASGCQPTPPAGENAVLEAPLVIGPVAAATLPVRSQVDRQPPPGAGQAEADSLPDPLAVPTPAVIGPDFAPGYNPLTGQPVSDPMRLLIRPMLVAISNFPVSTRPQSGLGSASQVWEIFIGQGMTRFLAVFYADDLDLLQAAADAPQNANVLIGPVRSGRVVFEDIKTLFPGAHLITAGASREVAEQLSNRSSVYSADPLNINSAGVTAADLQALTGAPADPGDYASLTFGWQAPEAGQPLDSTRIVYNLYNQVGWTYDEDRGAFLRFQDLADGSGELFPASDALSGEQLAFENVVVLFARHRYITPTILQMELLYVRDRKGLLLRDGLLLPIFWSSWKGKLQLTDAQGAIVPLKPGRTFFEVLSLESTWKAEDNVLLVRYHNPPPG